METIYFWSPRGEYGYLSQWYPSEFYDYEGIKYNCAEQYIMYQKAIAFKDFETAEKIIKETSPKIIQALGRAVKNFDQAIWDQCKFNIVNSGNFFKFTHNIDLKKKLLATGDTQLVEASPFDRVWGIGINAATAELGAKWRGENLLGKAIMEARDLIRERYSDVGE